MSDPPVDWRTEIATRVCTLVRDQHVRARFREQCRAYVEEIDRDEGQLTEWRLRRKEHCLRGLHKLAELKARMEETERLGSDREAIDHTRPAKDTDKNWVFDYYQDFLDPDDLARLGSPSTGHMLVGFGAWMPRELSLSASPKLTVPYLFARFIRAPALPTLAALPGLERFTGSLHSRLGTTVQPAPATWAEKYASLAAIHDACFPERDPIDQLHYVNWGRFAKELRKHARQSVRQLVDNLPDAASASVQEWLADVEADLVEHVGPPARPNSTGGEQSGTSDAAEQERRSRAQQQLTAAIEDLLARFDTDGPYGADFIGPGPVAGELAAILGFAVPPVEVIVIKRPDSHPIFDKHEHVVRVGTVRFNDPDGLTHAMLTITAFAEALPEGRTPEITELPSDMRAVSHARSILESWSRKIKSLNLQSVVHSPTHIPTRDDSLAIMAFKWRLGRELAGLGDPTPEEEMSWCRKHEDAMKQGLRGVLNELGRIAGNRFQLVAQVNPAAGREQRSPPHAEKNKGGDSTNVFRLIGAMWEIRFEDERGNFKNKRGYQIVAELLRRPNPEKPRSALSLAGADPRAGGEVHTFQPTIDSEGKAEIRKRIEDLKYLIAEAERNNDAAADRHKEELQRLADGLAKSHGLGGRDRDLSSTKAKKRAQSAVGQRVREVIDEISRSMPKLAGHLKASIRTGAECAYRPPINTPWTLDKET